MTILEKLDSYIAQGYEISIEASGGYSFVVDDEEDRPYYVRLFFGDSNGPHKPGTLVGVGRGWTMEEAFDKAVADLRHPVTKRKSDQES
jgi:hypothetical protein